MDNTNQAKGEQGRGPLRRAGRLLLRTAVVLFVTWHLLFMVVRNPLDLWDAPIRARARKLASWPAIEPWFKRVDRITWRYANFTGAGQGWSMFTPNLARGAPFLAGRIDFTDGSSELIRSFNEPDPQSYIRIGFARVRKLEDNIVYGKPDRLADDEDLPVYQAYVRWVVRRWKKQAGDDPRVPLRVTLLRRRIDFPKPGEDPRHYDEPTETVIGVFDPEGRLQ
jgi:hypothetical protein